MGDRRKEVVSVGGRGTLTGWTGGGPEREGETVLMNGTGGEGGIVLVARGREVDLAPGQKLRMELAQPIVLPALAHLASNGKE